MNRNQRLKGILIKIAGTLAGGIALFVLVLGLASAGFRSIYQGRIYPGIYLGWVNLSGQTPADAVEMIRREFTYPDQGQITLQYDDLSWEISPGELGMFFSPNYNAEIAFNTGRQGNIAQRIATQIQILWQGIVLVPEFVLDEQTGTDVLLKIADELNRPVVEASLKLEGLEVIVHFGKIISTTWLAAGIEEAYCVGVDLKRCAGGAVLPCVGAGSAGAGVRNQASFDEDPAALAQVVVACFCLFSPYRNTEPDGFLDFLTL